LLSRSKTFFGLQFTDETDRNRILGPHKKIQQWIEDTKNATKPHFDEVHQALVAAKVKLQMQRK
jgi:glutathione S-transferase